jgi:hypothetical protein
MLLVGGWLRWPGDCSWSRLTALLLERLLGVLLFTEARPMKPESSSGWFPLKSSPTCSYCWLHCDLQNVPRELPELQVLTGPRHLRYWLTELNCVVSLTAFRWTQVKTLLATIHVAFVGYHGKSCLLGCYLDTDLRKRYLVTEVLNITRRSRHIICTRCHPPKMQQTSHYTRNPRKPAPQNTTGKRRKQTT